MIITTLLRFFMNRFRLCPHILSTMIFVHPFNDNFGDNLVFLLFCWSKKMKREKKRGDNNII